MTWRIVTIAGFALVFASGLLVVVLSRLGRLAGFGAAVSTLASRHLLLRLLLVLAWAWLGWHFLARSG